MTRDKRKKRKDHASKKAVAKSHKSAKQAEKAQRKTSRLNANSDEEEEDIELLLKQFALDDQKKLQVVEEVCLEPPTARANASFIPAPGNQPVIYLFGGEHYDGNKLKVYNDLFKYRVDKKEWRKIVAPYSPGPRSGHQSVALNNGQLLVLAGEYASATQSQFHHWKDCWTFDVKENKWEKLDIATPPARSGHRMTVWKQYVVMFGGFYDNYKTTKYYDDLWIFDSSEYKWSKIDLPSTSLKPRARSGFQFFTYNDTCYLYGGYCKKQVDGDRDEGVVFNDMWMLHMNADFSTLKWEKVKNSGTQPALRAGCTMIVHKNRALLFGGVEDDEEGGDNCQCQNDMFSFNLDTRKWYKYQFKGEAARQIKNATGEEEPPATDLEESGPHRRYNAMLTICRGSLYLYGGLFEDRKKEFTLDDLWTLNPDKSEAWDCVIPGSWEGKKSRSSAQNGEEPAVDAESDSEQSESDSDDEEDN
ncbi:hypothetical protein DFS34DRAFT_649471 [Phlyctochytrium arcticum]|nr:hypothetical protein DFS34DRAFT_649471 [Phlyctochytrium arcticum]